MKEFICKCGKGFDRKDSLTRHMDTHSEEKNINANIANTKVIKLVI